MKNKNIIIAMERPVDIFESPPALARDIWSGRLPINLDKNFKYIENLKNYELWKKNYITSLLLVQMEKILLKYQK
jgi:hypothetical protein